MAHNDNIKSRFMKLAGLSSNTQPSISIHNRRLMTEDRVSELLSNGHSYTDIALMEQQSTGPMFLKTINTAQDPTAMANMVKQRENSIGYLNAATPTRQGLHDYMKNVRGFASDTPTTSSLSDSDLMEYLSYIGMDPNIVKGMYMQDGGSVGTPVSKLKRLFVDGASDEDIASFLTNPENGFTEHISKIASSNAAAAGEIGVANDLEKYSYSDIQSSASEIAPFKEANPTLFDQDPDNDVFGTTTDGTEENPEDSETPTGNETETPTGNETEVNTDDMSRELLSQKYPNAPEGYLDQVIQAGWTPDTDNEMTQWLDGNESLYSNVDNPYNPEYQTQEEPELQYMVGDNNSEDPMTDLATVLKNTDGKDLRKFLHDPANKELLNSVNAHIKSIDADWKVDGFDDLTKGGSDMNYNNAAIDFLTNPDNIATTVSAFNNMADNKYAKNIFKGKNITTNQSNIDAIRTQNQSQTDYNATNTNLQTNNPFQATETPSGPVETPDNVDNNDTKTTEYIPNYYDAAEAGTFNPSVYTNPEKAYDYQTGEKNVIDKTFNRDAKTDRGHRQVSIYVDPVTLMPVKQGTENAVELNPDDVYHKRDMSQASDQSNAYMAQNYPNIKPGTKKYNKLTKKYNKSISDVHQQHQKDLYKSDLKGKEVDYSSYSVTTSRHQKKNQKNKNKNKNDGNIKIADLLNTKVDGTNTFYDSSGRALPADLHRMR